MSFDDDPAATRQAAQAARVSFPVLMDPDGEAGRLYDVNELPLVVVIDREGRLRLAVAVIGFAPPYLTFGRNGIPPGVLSP